MMCARTPSGPRGFGRRKHPWGRLRQHHHPRGGRQLPVHSSGQRPDRRAGSIASSTSCARAPATRRSTTNDSCSSTIWRLLSEFPRYGARKRPISACGAQAAVQLFMEGKRRVGLNLYSRRARTLRSLHASSSLNCSPPRRHPCSSYAEQVEQLSEALHTRTDIGIAVGIVMERYGMDRRPGVRLPGPRTQTTGTSRSESWPNRSSPVSSRAPLTRKLGPGTEHDRCQVRRTAHPVADGMGGPCQCLPPEKASPQKHQVAPRGRPPVDGIPLHPSTAGVCAPDATSSATWSRHDITRPGESLMAPRHVGHEAMLNPE